MPKIQNRAVGSKRLNTVFADYPNVYWKLHEGLAGTHPGDIPDQNGSDLVLSPATEDVNQWDGVENAIASGYWWGMSTNSDACLVCSRSDSPAAFDALFNFNNSTVVMMCSLFADTDPSDNSNRFFTLGHQNPGNTKFVEGKYLSTGILTVLVDFGTPASADGVDLPAQAAPNKSVLMVMIDGAAETVTIMCYKPGTKILQLQADESAITSPTFPTSYPTNSTFLVGASQTNIINNNFAKELGIRDVRVINFGTSPPSDLSAILEELAVNSCLGTRR